jgi:flagellar biosynthetic protein FlhF
MKIKKYIAKSMKEALIQIKQELGEDAIILKTSKTPRKMFSLAGHDEIEVTAAIDEQSPTKQAFAALNVPDTGVYTRPKASAKASRQHGNHAMEDEGPQAFPFQPPLLPSAVRDDAFQKQSVVEIKDDIRKLKELLTPILQPKSNETMVADTSAVFDAPWSILYNRLINCEVKAGIAGDLITRIKETGPLSPAEADKRFLDELNVSFAVSGPLKTKDASAPLVCAFVGPTGAGKTTTLAKLAAHYKLNKNKSISVVTADTYRIAAIEQIRTFTDIMNIQLQVVFSPEEVEEALAACANDDIVFVDTAGRSRKNAEHMRDLHAFLEVLHPDETHLVLSATTKDADCISMVEQYRPFGVNRILFTKLDETNKLGNIFNTVVQSKMPVSYFTFGQGVPDDIELAQPARFVQRMWKEAME